MHFALIDAVVERSPDRVVAVKHVSNAEEYLQDHFPTFPVLPGVLMLEAMVQAARTLLAQADPAGARWTLGAVRALKYGAMVRPGDTLRVEVSLTEKTGESAEFKGMGIVVGPSAPPENGDRRTAVAGKFTLRPMRV